MRRNGKIFCGVLLIPMLIGCNKFGFGKNSSDANGEVKEIIIDGGGDISNFNTTASMNQSEANPYPYNTLETLCKEWMQSHPKYKVTINKTSSNGDRTILVPQLNNHTAPDITYQNGTVINSDLGKDFYVKLNDYFQKPNPYVEGNKHWIDIYQPEEIAQNLAPDGGYYTVCLEKIPVGIMYNKSLLTKCGVSELPNDFGSFIKACQKVSSYAQNASSEAERKITAYSTTGQWYEIFLESNIFSDILSQCDVIRKNGVLDQEEIVRAFVKGYWNPTLNMESDLAGNKFYDYIKLCVELGKIQAPLSYATHEGFVNGELAFLQVTGREIRKLSGNNAMNFEWGVLPFLKLSDADYPNHAAPSFRGVAGLATSWWVTKSAEDKGTVEGCIDLLNYLTAPKYNNRLIGDLKGGIPLNPNEDYEMPASLKTLCDQYKEDQNKINSGETCCWGAVNSWGILGYSYYVKFVKTLQDIQNGIQNVETATKSLAKSIKQTVAALRIENNYDEMKW